MHWETNVWNYDKSINITFISNIVSWSEVGFGVCVITEFLGWTEPSEKNIFSFPLHYYSVNVEDCQSVLDEWGLWAVRLRPSLFPEGPPTRHRIGQNKCKGLLAAMPRLERCREVRGEWTHGRGHDGAPSCSVVPFQKKTCPQGQAAETLCSGCLQIRSYRVCVKSFLYFLFLLVKWMFTVNLRVWMEL